MHRVRAVALGAVVALGCHHGGASKKPVASCRELGQAGERWLLGLRDGDRAEALAVAVELIDQCQSPGLAPAIKTCVAAAASPAEARTCPGLVIIHRGEPLPLPVQGDDGDQDDDGDDEGLPVDDDLPF